MEKYLSNIPLHSPNATYTRSDNHNLKNVELYNQCHTNPYREIFIKLRDKRMKISLEKAIEIVREIEQNLSPFGYHCGLTGSTLYKGESEKDIDIIVYPHQVSETIPLNSVVEASGVESSMYSTNGHLKPKEISPSTTDKLVVVGTYKGYRIDLFILQ